MGPVAAKWSAGRRAASCGWMSLWTGLGLCGMIPATSGKAHGATNKPPVPEARLSFQALGIPSLSASFLGSGASMLTVNFVDDRHLLVTFGTRGLVPRTPDDQEGDQDRIVAAELVELPVGKVLARTQWHLHDHGRYLWPLGEGRFLLRIHQELSTFAPLANLEHEPWTRTAFAHRRGELKAVEVSADSKLLEIMTAPQRLAPRTDSPAPAHSVNVTGSGEVVDRTAGFVAIDFYRIAGGGGESSPLHLEHAGSVRSPEAIRLPVDGDGYLRSQNAPRGMWKVSFEGYEGASRALAPVGSTCPPVLTLTSRAQLLAFTCRSGLNPDAITMQAYDFAGHEMWEEPIGEVPVTPSFAYAPQAGRFAMSRLLPVATTPQPEGTTGMPTQELRVYQTQSGDLLLKVTVTPTFRTAENYDLAPDGLRAVVVHEGELDLYRLPALNKDDREDLAAIAQMEPPPGTRGPINLRKLVEDDAQPAPLKAAEGTVAAATGTPVDLSGATDAGERQAGAAAAPQSAEGGDGHGQRKPPTLLKPGEKAEYKDKASPQ